MIQSETAREKAHDKAQAASTSESVRGIEADLRARPIRLRVRAPRIPGFRLESAPRPAGPPRRVILHHNGNEFSVTVSMALIFQKNAARVRAAGESELVVLVHIHGVELLLITPTTPFRFGVSPAVGAEGTIRRPSAPPALRPRGRTAAEPRSAELALST